MKKLLAIAFLWTATAASLSGQSPTEDAVQGPTFRTGVDLIAVDVAVVDGKGNPVEGLLPPDFAVEIDGEQRRVVSAEHVRIDVEAARREAAADKFQTLYTTNLKPPNGRLIVIAIDQMSVRFGSARSILASAAKFLDRLSPADRVAFVAYPEPGVSIGFTSDHARLRLGMERIVGRQQGFSGRFNIGLYEAIAISEKADGLLFSQVAARVCPRLAGMELDQCEREVLTEAGTMVQGVRQDAAESLRALYDLLMALSTVEGPKSLILLSEGLVLDSPADLESVIRAAALARVTINVLLMDVPRNDITVGALRPTVTEDRDMQTKGLGDLAGGSRGSLYYVVGTGETVFERLAGDMLAYYLLGVEQAPSDRDGQSHRVDVEVRRRGVTVKSRRAFVLSAPTTTRRNAEETLLDALKSPFGVAEVPLRVTTFTQKDTSSDKARIVIAAEVGRPGGEPEEFTVGFVLLDSEGAVVSGSVDKRVLSVPDGSTNAPRDYLGEIVVEPGNYSLRFGVVDSSGRRGGVIREVNAWKLGGEEFALGDLLIGDAGIEAAQRIRPGVEPRVRGNLGALLDLYSTSPAVLDSAEVSFEIADDQDAPALLTGPAEATAGAQPTQRTVLGVLSAALLPPGRYVARARVTRDGNVAGVLVRPFILDAAGVTALGAASPFIRGAVAKFDSRIAMTPQTVRTLLDSVEKRFPELTGALVEARAGRYGIAAIEALTSGDQAAAAFFKGLDWYAKGQLNQAVTQLELAAGPRRDFFAAAFYLGAAFAAAGRDRDAAGVWQIALGNEPRPQFAYTLLADARLRDGQPTSVVDILKPAYERTPVDDEVAYRLMAAYLMLGRYEEALPVLHGYLSRHATDEVALFAAVFAQYQVVTRERLVLPAADLTRLARYVRAYQGRYQPLLAKYLQLMRGR
ncbi:MAG: VWA domain-containing protein [Acidobacteria bacterium]|nr:VWA domain-containing protein [Acidobacteriota bacterium]